MKAVFGDAAILAEAKDAKRGEMNPFFAYIYFTGGNKHPLITILIFVVLAVVLGILYKRWTGD